MREALQDLRVSMDMETEIDEMFRCLDLDGDNVLCFEEFQQVIKHQTSVERWASTVPFFRLLADAIPVSDDEIRSNVSVLRKASQLKPEDIEMVCLGMLDGLKVLVSEKIQTLKKAYKSMDENHSNTAGSAKFVVNSMSCGGTKDFHNGLEGRVGSPHLKFYEAMEAEHCSRFGNSYQLTTSNYGITTCPKDEWTIVVRRKGLTEQAFMAILEKEGIKIGLGPEHYHRRIPDVIELLKTSESKAAKLIESEVMAIILYTGPMFMLYNTILRHFPKNIFEHFANRDDPNMFPTTIHVLVSAVQKLSRAIRIPHGTKLFRGLGGTTDLPPQFFKADELGCKGYAEWAFMSTTSNRDIAIQYSGMRDGKPKAMVLEISVGAVDRGACLQTYSQYPEEKEYLWLPLSFLQQDRDTYLEVTEGGAVSIVPVRIIPNLKTSTVEEALAKKKSIHIAAFRYLIDELQIEMSDIMETPEAKARYAECRRAGIERQDVEWSWDNVTPSNFVSKTIERCRKVLETHSALDPVEYTNEEVYRSLSSEMVNTKRNVKSCVMEFLQNRAHNDFRNLLDDGTAFLSWHRQYISFLKKSMRALPEGRERQQAALHLCQMVGLAGKDGANGRNELGEPCLERAIHEGVGLEGLRLLLEAGADAGNAVEACCFEGDVGALDLVVGKFGVKPEQSYDLLSTAAQGGHVACIRTLVAAKVDVNARHQHGYNPVYWAAESGQVESVKSLIELKADVNIHDMFGWSPRMTVVQRNQTAERMGANRAILDLLDGAAMKMLEENAKKTGFVDEDTEDGQESLSVCHSEGRKDRNNTAERHKEEVIVEHRKDANKTPGKVAAAAENEDGKPVRCFCFRR